MKKTGEGGNSSESSRLMNDITFESIRGGNGWRQ